MPSRTVVVKNQAGLHARVAIMLAKVVRQFQSTVELVKDHKRANGAEVLQLMTLTAFPGDKLVLEANGADAEQVLDALVKLFDDHFGEEPADPSLLR